MITLILMAGLSAHADDTVTVKPVAQYRPRAEWHTGRDGVAGTGDVFVISHRARVGGIISSGDVTAKIVLQDVRGWGNEKSTMTVPAAGLDVRSANLTWKASDNLTFKIGRQHIAFDGQRLIGAVDWSQPSRAFDAVRINYKTGKFHADVVGTVLGDAPALNEAWATMLHTGLTLDQGVVNGILVVDNDLGVNRTRVTSGVYTKMQHGPIQWRAEGYYQGGNEGNQTLSGYMVGLQATYAPESSINAKFTLWYDLLSGDNDLTDSRTTSFNTLYATNHQYYGNIDILWKTLAADKDGRGLQDAAIKFQMSPVDKVTVHLDGHVFMAAAKQGGPSTIGEEIDLKAGYKISKNLAFLSGASVLARTVGDPDTWVWTQLDAKFN